MGRLTLNPIKHIDPIGLLMMMLFKFGWAKPVPVNMHSFERPKWYMALTAIAGPISNIILAIIVLFILGLVETALGGPPQGGEGYTMYDIIFRTAYLSTALAVFNLMPIPPLDGSKVLFSFFSDRTYFKLMKYERFGIILLIIVLNTDFFGKTIGQLTLTLFTKLSIFMEAAYKLVN